MISFVKGPLAEVLQDRVVIESGNVGLEVFVPLSVMGKMPGAGKEIKLYTYFQVREDAMSLYGFWNRQDLQMFKQLISVSGVGPKAALGVLSAMSPDQLRLAIVTGDLKAITRAPGIGSKTAQRIIVDLKDKISAEELLPFAYVKQESDVSSGRGAAKEAAEALMALGYSASEAGRAVHQVEVTELMTAEDVLKASLKYLTFL